MENEDNRPLFDTVKAALIFALNADNVLMPRPFMNKAMAEIKIKPKVKKVKPGAMTLLVDDSAEALLVRSLEEKPRSTPPDRPQVPGGLDAAGQAGFILATLARMELVHQSVLTGLFARPADPCLCYRPCCSGWLPNPRWVSAVKQTCYILKESGDVLGKLGRKGLSTHPEMRATIVRDFFRGRKSSLDQLVFIADGVTLKTAAKHRAWIVAFLEQALDEARVEADEIFDQAGIVGGIS